MKKGMAVIASFLLAAGLLVSCSDGSNGGNAEGQQGTGAGGSGVTLRTSKVKFDFANAEALAKLESSSSSRAAASSDDLSDIVKILKDGKMESAITVANDTELADIVAVYKSPLATSNDVFVVFEHVSTLSSEYDSTTKTTTYTHLGQLVCVHENGTVLDILNVDSSSESTDYEGKYISIHTDSIQFDAQGNLYFCSNAWGSSYSLNGEESRGEVIYQFDPSTNEITEMVAAVNGTYYGKMQLDNAGDWIFVSGQRGNASFLRAIPVSNPNRFVNIAYSSSYADYTWIYDDNAEVIYYTAYANNKSGLFTATKRGGFTDSTFHGSGIGENFTCDFLDSFGSYYSSYTWDSAVKNGETFDATKALESILDAVYSATNYVTSTDEYGNTYSNSETVGLTAEMVDIRFDAYSNATGARRALALLTQGKKNEAALRALDSNLGRAALYNINREETTGSISISNENFFEDILYVKDTDTLLKDNTEVLFTYADYDGTEHKVTGADIFAGEHSFSNFFYNHIGYEDYGDTRFTFAFSQTFYKNNTLDSAAVLDYLFSYCNEDGIKEFRLDAFNGDETYGALYSSQTDEAAIEWLASDVDRLNLFGKVFLSSNGYNYSNYAYFMKFISKTCFIAGTNTKATYWNSGDNGWVKENNTKEYWWNETISYTNLRNFTVNENGLFATYSNVSDGGGYGTVSPYYYIIQIADSTGKFVDLQNKLSVPTGIVTQSQSYPDRLMLQYSLTDSEDNELGYHHIYAVAFETGIVTNCFDNVPNRNGLEVVSFSVAGDLLYYSAVRGTTVENGIVDIPTNEYAPLGINRKMVAVYSFN